ncbi:hypothetical protein [Maritalea sp.]|uniref:TadE/TadG family type IV pilus assembly protein n=1 Tax=Maritalea sp. TaxID=2003361 RepID=UPI003EF5F804
MSFILSRLKQFGRNESGAFVVIFAIMSVVLIATGGSAVDFVTIQQNRKAAQVSLDATVLALHPEIFKKSSGWIQSRAQDLVVEGVGNSEITVNVDKITVDKDEGRLYLSATIKRPTLFVRLIGINEMTARLESEATRAKNRLEVAMVLDNSGSMGGSRIAGLKTAAKLAVDILSGGESKPDKVFIGIVPFTQYVNIGSKKRKAKGVDINGQSPLSWDNFDDDDNQYTGHDTSNSSDRLNRLSIYASIPNADWEGCVEARSHNSSKAEADRLDVNDVEPVYGTSPGYSYGETLFVPVFQPDYPDVNYWQPLDYLNDWKNNGSCAWDWNLSQRELQERVCKYAGRYVDRGDGPNAGCGDVEVLPLTNKMSKVKARINSMVADGGTNIHQGAIWGWRLLSPTKPFTEGVAYDEGASKVMIVMTDGANFASQANNLNGSSYYSAYGWPYNGRLGGMGWWNSQVISEMDKRTKLACKHAKAKDVEIEIFTIGLGISKNSSNGKMLSDCSSGNGHDFFPSNVTELKKTFEKIADQLSDLRISK